MQPKRRLPVLKDVADDEPVRPAWQWIVFGTLAIFVVWLPIAAVTMAMLMHLGRGAGGGGLEQAPLLRAAVFAAGLAAAAFAGGYLIGRWGPGGVGTREAALAGLAAAGIASALAWGVAGVAGVLVTAGIAVPAAALGGRSGFRRRTPGG